MSINIDNALTDTIERLPTIIMGAASADANNTPEGEPRWLVNFKGHYDEILHLEIIIRDSAIVMSVLNNSYDSRDTAKIMGVFMELLNIE